VEELNKYGPMQAVLELKKGAQVILMRNISNCLTNGTRGVVTGFVPVPHEPIVKFQNGIETAIAPQCWEIKNGSTRAERRQIPLNLAYAISIHKSQVHFSIYKSHLERV
jgi:ATP-dependent DNA helicase PIF1